MKLISVVVPVSNNEDYLTLCLDSLLQQTYTNLQIILVDESSSNDAKLIIQNYQSRDDRICCVSQENHLGEFQAMITGARYALGDYLSFVNSTDYIGIDYFRLLIAEAEANSADIVISRLVVTHQNKYVYSQFDSIFSGFAIDNVNIPTFQEVTTNFLHKIYCKTLWDQCFSYLQSLKRDGQLIENITLLTLLMYFSTQLSRAENSVYYQRQYNNDSKNAEKTSIDGYEIEQELKNIKSTFHLIIHFFEKHRITKNSVDFITKYNDEYLVYLIQKNGKILDLEEKQKLFNYYSYSSGQYEEKECLGEMLKTEWNDSLEEIKQRICSAEYKYISFDFFDTLITRPFYQPADLFNLLNKSFKQIHNSNTNFRQIRIDCEIGARTKIQQDNPNDQDVSIDEIYNYMQEIYGFTKDDCEFLKAEEKRLEIEFCTCRKTGKELYDLARHVGKSIIIVSDMYLDEGTITTLLNKNGYTEYDQIFLSSKERRLKHTGDLFQVVLNKLDVRGNNILHIGDNFHSDIKQASDAGLHAAYLPRTIHVFENKVKGLDTGECSTAGFKVGGVILDHNKLLESIGYGCMIALTANHYFDNPFRPFNKETDYNADSYFMGYYALGMHAAGLMSWILKETPPKSQVLFVDKEGLFMKRVFDLWTHYFEDLPGSLFYDFPQKMITPLLIENLLDFMNFSIDYNLCTPKDILNLFNFCTKSLEEDEIKRLLKTSDILANEPFRSKYKYQQFIKWYYDHLYDETKHTGVKLELENFFSGIAPFDVVFGIESPTNTHRILYKISSVPIKSLFVYANSNQDDYKSTTTSTFYDFTPALSDLFRRYIMSDPSYMQPKQDLTISTVDRKSKLNPNIFVIERLQQGALHFISDFCSTFKYYLEDVPFKSYEVSLPFESLLRMPKKRDLNIFKHSYIEDTLFQRGTRSIAQYMEKKYKLTPQLDDARSIELLKSALTDHIRFTRKLVYFGSGRIARDMFTSYPELPVSFLIDNDKNNKGRLLGGKAIKHPEEIDNWNDLFIIITTLHSSAIEYQLEQLGLLRYKNYIIFKDFFKLT